jgi:hypothetical protein
MEQGIIDGLSGNDHSLKSAIGQLPAGPMALPREFPRLNLPRFVAKRASHATDQTESFEDSPDAEQHTGFPASGVSDHQRRISCLWSTIDGGAWELIPQAGNAAVISEAGGNSWKMVRR